VVLLDERGQDLDSPGLARWLEEAARDAVTCLHFAIGGAYGHPPEAQAHVWRQLRLSSLVLNQAVARVVLMEQLYRACTIRAGEPYHHG
jgi:23S rRNA (pseudouridine1915-N3)-methyltransferase